MRFAGTVLAATLATAPLAAAPAVTGVTIELADRHFRPQVVRLKHGLRYRVTLINRDGTGHNFDSKAFFSHASISPEGAGDQAIHEGLISVPAHDARTFWVTPIAPGPFDLTSSVALDVAAGMQGQILVY